MPKIVSSAIDTIECSIYVDLKDEIISELYDAKQEARKYYKNVEFYLGDQRFVMYPNRGKYYEYLLKSDKYELDITTSSNLPTVSAKIKSITLYEMGPLKALEKLYAAIEILGEIKEKKIKRIDLCVDFQDWIPKERDIDRFICKATYRPTDRDENSVTGFRLITKKMLVRIYDKTKEIIVSKKPWFYDVWQQNPDYQEGIPVWRVEIQLRREKLVEIGIDTVDDALESLRGIWEFGLEWAELKKPTRNKQRTRWPIDRRWKHLKDKANFKGKTCQKVRRAKRKADEYKLAQMFGAYLTSIAALYGDMTIEKALYRAGVSYSHYLRERGLDFTSVVQSKIEQQEQDLPF